MAPYTLQDLLVLREGRCVGVSGSAGGENGTAKIKMLFLLQHTNALSL